MASSKTLYLGERISPENKDKLRTAIVKILKEKRSNPSLVLWNGGVFIFLEEVVDAIGGFIEERTKITITKWLYGARKDKKLLSLIENEIGHQPFIVPVTKFAKKFVNRRRLFQRATKNDLRQIVQGKEGTGYGIFVCDESHVLYGFSLGLVDDLGSKLIKSNGEKIVSYRDAVNRRKLTDQSGQTRREEQANG